MNHLLQFYYDKNTKQVDFLNLSLNPFYSRWVEVDFYNKKSRIIIYNNNERQYIELPRIIEPDFNNLTPLKEKISLFIAFS